MWASHVGAQKVTQPEVIVAAHLKSLGAEVNEPPVRVFLQQGESRVVAQGVDDGPCVGFVAFGVGAVRDVDLSLHTEGGLALDEDASAAPYAYVRGCPGRSQTWFLNASLYAGRGELIVLRVDQAPSSIGLLPFDLGLAAPSGGRPERPRAVGPSLPPTTLEQHVSANERAWAQRGYSPGSALLRVPMASGLARAVVPLEQGLCYAVVVTSSVSRHTALVVAGPSGRRWAGADRGPEAVAYVCPEDTDEHAVFVRAQPGSETLLVRAYAHGDAVRWQPHTPGTDRARAQMGELTYTFEQRGLHSEVVGEGWVDTVSPLRWPVHMQAGHCYALGAVSMATTLRGAVELALEGPGGELLARHRLRTSAPYVFHCARRSGTYRLIISATGEVGRVAVVRGERSLSHTSRGARARR